MSSDLKELIRARGLSLTAVRLAMLKYFNSIESPVSADQLVKSLSAEYPSLNRTTVYRELMRLVDKGLIEEVLLVSRARVYELVKDHHHHMVCTQCDAIQRIDIPKKLCSTELSLFKNHGFKVFRHSLEFYGLCKRCN